MADLGRTMIAANGQVAAAATSGLTRLVSAIRDEVHGTGILSRKDAGQP